MLSMVKWLAQERLQEEKEKAIGQFLTRLCRQRARCTTGPIRKIERSRKSRITGTELETGLRLLQSCSLCACPGRT